MIYENYSVFAVGPVSMYPDTLELGAKQTPYFRNKLFSDVLLKSEALLLKMLNAPIGSRVVFLTASGTAGMEATVMNLLNQNDKAIVVNGGTFGDRFASLCKSHFVPHDELIVDDTDLNNLNSIFSVDGHTAFLVNAHETSVGRLYNLESIGNFCRAHNLLNIVDAISMFVTDYVDMQEHSIDALILSSQKGLALPPGLSMIVLTPKAISRLKDVNINYFDFKNYLSDGERGQTPYTPAVTIILQLLQRLEMIEKQGGIKSTIKQAEFISNYFRRAIAHLPLKFYSKYMPNAMTSLMPTDGKNALDIVRLLEEKYHIIVCPNGGALSSVIFRVSHMGYMTKEYVDNLINALNDIYNI
ncbi:alanine--glyoxylate aminotransferase family protein [Haemophilus haemoglobinophilus]|nr:alanine--glyoxylate aminotransferase family protein [Canicola haemoglobinophilus]